MTDKVTFWLLRAIDKADAGCTESAIFCLKKAKDEIALLDVVAYGDALIECENVAESIGLLEEAYGGRHVPVGSGLWAQYYRCCGF